MALVNFPGEFPGKITKWKVKKGTRVYSGSLLALYENSESKTVMKLKATGVGTVLELLADQNQEILPGVPVIKIEGCKHPTVMKDMCAECGEDLRREDTGPKKDNTSASVAMVASIPELIVSEEEALEIGKSDEERLLKNRKLVLLVDLDQTLIHTTNDTIPANLKDVYHFQLWHGKNLLWYHTKLRPGIETFLKNISKQYELHICTFGVRMYAHTIAKFIDPEGNFFSHRILSRDECFSPNSKTANLKALFPRGDSMVAIIDDREDVWNFLPNVIHVKPYLFFEGTADINAPPSLKKDEPAGQKRRAKIVKVPKKKISSQEREEQKSDSESKTAMEVDSSDPNSSKDMDSVEKVEDEFDSKNDDVSEEKKDDVDRKEVPEGKEKSKDERAVSSSADAGEKYVEKRNTAEMETTDENGKSKENDENPNDEAAPALDEGSSEISHSDDEGKEKCKDVKGDDDSEYEELIEWEDEDDYLLYLEDVLHKVHTAFYELHDQMKATEKKNVPNVKKIIPYVRRKVLKGTNILFSGVFPTKVLPQKCRAYVVAQALGANVQSWFVPRGGDNASEATTHVVAAKLGTVKVREAQKAKGVHVVTPEWLWTCNDRWERVDERLYYLNDKNSRYDARDSPDVSRMKRQKRKRIDKQFTAPNTKKVKTDSTMSVETVGDQDIQVLEDEEMLEDNTTIDVDDEVNDEMENEDDGAEEKPSTSKPKLERQFSDTLNPLISFSKDDIDNMDKEVEDLLDEPDTDDSDTKEQEKIKKRILSNVHEESSSEDSLSADFPRGWNIKRKRKKLPSEEGEEDEDELEDIAGGDSNRTHRIFKHSDQSSSSENSDFNESVGSVDEEMAEAVEREFLNY